jgi:hypothetical protein
MLHRRQCTLAIYPAAMLSHSRCCHIPDVCITSPSPLQVAGGGTPWQWGEDHDDSSHPLVGTRDV